MGHQPPQPAPPRTLAASRTRRAAGVTRQRTKRISQISQADHVAPANVNCAPPALDTPHARPLAKAPRQGCLSSTCLLGHGGRERRGETLTPESAWRPCLSTTVAKTVRTRKAVAMYSLLTKRQRTRTTRVMIEPNQPIQPIHHQPVDHAAQNPSSCVCCQGQRQPRGPQSADTERTPQRTGTPSRLTR